MADPVKVEAVRKWPTPKTQTEVRSFLRLASYYRWFVRGFGYSTSITSTDREGEEI